MATEKTPNYSEAQTAALVEAYTAEPTRETVDAFAAKFGKTAKSVIAKLVREGVYHRKEYTTKTGDKPVKKDDQADAIGRILKMSDGEADSLAKANKTALSKIVKALAHSIPVEPETDGERMAKAQAVQSIAEILALDAKESDSLMRANVSPIVKIAAAIAA
jgi:hypothetical protein